MAYLHLGRVIRLKLMEKSELYIPKTAGHSSGGKREHLLADTFGYINGTVLEPIATYKGSLPNQAQVGEYEGHLAWISDNKLFLWGSRDPNIPVRLFQYASPAQTTAGAFAVPFGNILISSYATTNYSLAKLGGYTKTSDWTTIALSVSGPGYKSMVDLIQIETDVLASGAQCDTTLYYDKAGSNKSLSQIAYSVTNNKTVVKPIPF